MNSEDPEADRIESILAACLDRPEAEWAQAVAEACAEHRAFADGLRRRFEALCAFGLVSAAPGEAETTFGSYRLVRSLGSGTTSTVYLATTEGREQPVALKILRPDMLRSPLALMRFQREVELASRLDHPGLCQVVDSGSQGGVPFIAMRHLEGRTLAAAIAEAREQGPPRLVGDQQRWTNIVEAVARALHVAHEAGLVHRDVKPANIMLGSDGRPVLMDLGLAADLEESRRFTLPGTLVGTPLYMAPEVVGSDARPDPRADVYGLGVTLFECLAQRPPFSAPTREALFQQVLQGPAPDLRAANPHVPRELALVVETALARRPGRRYATAEALADDLGRWREGRRLVVRPPGLLRRAARWVADHRVAAAFLLLLAAGLTTTGTLLLRTRVALDRANAVALASASGDARTTDPELATLLALQAVQRHESIETVSALHAALAAMHAWEPIAPERALEDPRFQGGFGVGRQFVTIDGEQLRLLDRSPDGSRLLTRSAARRSRVGIWEREEAGWQARGELAGHQDEVTCATFAPDGKRILTGSQDQTARIWNLAGQVLERMPRHGCIVTAARFSPDARLVLTGGGDGVARLFDSVGHPLAEFRGHGGQIIACAIGREGRTVATASEDQTVRVWQRESPARLRIPGHGRPLVAGRIGPDGRLLIVDWDGHPIWMDEQGRPLAPPGAATTAPGLMTAGGRALLQRAGEDWNVLDREGRVLGVLEEASSAITSAALGPGLLVAVHGTRLSWWRRVEEGSWPKSRTLDLREDLMAVNVAPGGSPVACGTRDGRLFILGSADIPLAEARCTGGIWTVEFAPDGASLLAASKDNSAHVFGLDGRELARLQGHGGTVLCAAFSPQGDLIATASVDTTVRIWDRTGRPLAILRAHQGQVRHLAWSSDGRRLLSCSADSTARIWTVRTGDLVALARRSVSRPLTPQERLRYADLLEE